MLRSTVITDKIRKTCGAFIKLRSQINTGNGSIDAIDYGINYCNALLLYFNSFDASEPHNYSPEDFLFFDYRMHGPVVMDDIRQGWSAWFTLNERPYDDLMHEAFVSLQLPVNELTLEGIQSTQDYPDIIDFLDSVAEKIIYNVNNPALMALVNRDTRDRNRSFVLIFALIWVPLNIYIQLSLLASITNPVPLLAILLLLLVLNFLIQPVLFSGSANISLLLSGILAMNSAKRSKAFWDVERYFVRRYGRDEDYVPRLRQNNNQGFFRDSDSDESIANRVTEDVFPSPTYLLK